MFTVDIGNSSLSVAHWLGAEVSVEHFNEPAAAARVIDGPAWILSVSAPRLEQFLSALAAPCRGEVTVLKGVPMALADPRLAASTGSDRLAAALGVCPGPAIVIDAGTALTVDLVDAADVFLGGFIAPGPQAALDGLSQAGSALPPLPFERCELSPGRDTASAMCAGVWGMVVGGADQLVRAALGVLPGARLVAGGGWAAAWLAASKLSGVSLDEHLVHRGIARWAGRQGDEGQGLTDPGGTAPAAPSSA